jgi:hypothetical protein
VADIPEGAEERRSYSSYLLRLWQVEDTGGSVWRASLKSAHSGEQVGFASLADLFTFLENETGSPSPGARSAAKAGGHPPAMPER